MVTDLTRPIIGIENRTAQEVFDIMCDRLRAELGNEEAPRYTTRRLREEVRKAEERGKQYEREAALSTDAEPVGYLKEAHADVIEPRYIDAKERVQDWQRAVFTIPVYSAPPQPAPSVAVKALHQAASDFMHIFIQDGHLTVQDIEDTDLIPAYEKLSAALTAQVQDVATAMDALQAIANLPTGDNLDVSQGQEEAYRAVEALFSTPPNIQVQDVAVPEGWQLVPKYATVEMENAAFEKVRPYHDISERDWRSKMPKDLFRLAWPSMLAAAPAAKLEGKP